MATLDASLKDYSFGMISIPTKLSDSWNWNIFLTKTITIHQYCFLILNNAIIVIKVALSQNLQVKMCSCVKNIIYRSQRQPTIKDALLKIVVKAWNRVSFHCRFLRMLILSLPHRMQAINTEGLNTHY